MVMVKEKLWVFIILPKNLEICLRVNSVFNSVFKPFFIFWSESFAVQNMGIISDPGSLVVQFGDHTSGLFTLERRNNQQGTTIFGVTTPERMINLETSVDFQMGGAVISWLVHSTPQHG